MEVDKEAVVRNGKIQPPYQFLLLCFFTLSLYCVWWHYKTWRFFKERDGRENYPAVRALFNVFFVYSLLRKINADAKEVGHLGSRYGLYAVLYIVGLLLFNLVSVLPDPYFYLFLFVGYYAFLIPGIRQLNFYFEAVAPDVVPRRMSRGAKIALGIGIAYFMLLLLVFLLPEDI